MISFKGTHTYLFNDAGMEEATKANGLKRTIETLIKHGWLEKQALASWGLNFSSPINPFTVLLNSLSKSLVSATSLVKYSMPQRLLTYLMMLEWRKPRKLTA
jgi:hypothetical protein